MLNTLSGIVKFLIGFVIALALVVAGGVASARYFITQMTNPPPKPIFPNDLPSSSTNNSASARKTSMGSARSLPAGAYEARVTWPDGLILRDRPSYNAIPIGGIEYNGRVIVLGESSDKIWQQVSLEYSSQEGWIKGGNVEPIN